MKVLSVVLVVLGFILGISASAHATPMYYTFQGSVTSVSDPTGIIASSGYAVESPINYTILIDTAVQGYYTTIGGTKTTYSDTGTKNYFYADFISGNALPMQGDGYYTSNWRVAEYNYGYVSSYTNYTLIQLNSDNNMIQLTTPTSPYTSILDWVANETVGQGTKVRIESDSYADNSSRVSKMFSDVWLTSISATNPSDPPSAAVPEPATLLLLGSGLVCLAGLGRRKMFKK